MDFLNSTAVITLCRMNRYLRQSGNNILSDIAEQFSDVDVSEFSEYVNDDIETMSESKKRYMHIIDLFESNYRELAGNITDFALMLFYLPDVKHILDKNNINIDIYQILKINESNFFNYGYISVFLRQAERIFLIDDDNHSFVNKNICIDNRLAGYLSGNDFISADIKNICSIFTRNDNIHKLIINENSAERISYILNDKNSVVHIIGDSQTGKKFVLKHSARKNGREVLFIDFSLLMRYDAGNIPYALWNISREALLYNRILCWYNVDKETLAMKKWKATEFIALCIENFIDNGVQVCICSDSFIDLSYHCKYAVNVVNIRNTDENDRIFIWKEFCEIYNFSDVEYYNMAMRYKLTISQISQVFRKRMNCYFSESLSENQIFGSICSETGYVDGNLLKLKVSDYTFDDLKLPEYQISIFKQICENFKNSHVVYNEWNMKKKFPYGRGISLLLTGPPGTGKTMTACVIANELGIPLYQADMSQIVDKYIGETEKNLDAVFDEAEKRNCILFLDEADSLCGKRSEINDSKDKYANNDTAFILQRIENYDGIVILATNYINNIDNAFMRRMKYVVMFSVPDENIRYQIWKSSFTDKVPVDESVDFEYLAKQFEFSGSNIKNIVLASAFLSASEGVSVNMKHILKNVYNEYQKQQRHMFSVEFGKYEDLYNEIIL